MDLETGPHTLLEQWHSDQYNNPSAAQNTNGRISVLSYFEHQIPEVRL